MRVVETTQGKFRVNVPVGYDTYNRNDDVDWIDFELATKGQFSPIHSWIVEQFITHHSVVVDVGAHIGTFTVHSAKKAKAVHAFEPVITSYQRLEDHIVLNNLSNVTPYKFALGDRLGLTQIDYMPTFNTGAAKLDISQGSFIFENLGDEHTPPTYNILVKTLDSLDLPAMDFLKCDTEGCEALVVAGALETIKKYRPVMLMEHNYPAQRDEVMKLLKDAGMLYRCTKVHDPTMGLSQSDTDYLYEPL